MDDDVLEKRTHKKKRSEIRNERMEDGKNIGKKEEKYRKRNEGMNNLRNERKN
jgi:hypothetical protein